MSIRMFVAPFLLIMLLGSQIILLPSQAIARWCGCGNCWMMYAKPGSCTCGPPYYWCLDDSNPLQDNASTDNHLADSSSIPEELMSTIAKPDVAERVLDLMSGGKCFRDRVALSLFGSEVQKFMPIRLDEKNLLALQIDAGNEK